MQTTEQFSFHEADEMLIEQESLKLNSKKSVGPDAIPPKIIKDSINVIKPQLTKLFKIIKDSINVIKPQLTKLFNTTVFSLPILSMSTYHLFLKRRQYQKGKL